MRFAPRLAPTAEEVFFAVGRLVVVFLVLDDFATIALL